MGLLNMIPNSALGYKGQQPPKFDLGPNSTVHNTSSIYGTPNFGTYKSAYLRRQKPTQLAGPQNPKRYVSPE
jgi:hypothetical protein